MSVAIGPVQRLVKLIAQESLVDTRIRDTEAALALVKKRVSESLAQHYMSMREPRIQLPEELMREEQSYERLLQALQDMKSEIAKQIRPVEEQIIQANIEHLRQTFSQESRRLANGRGRSYHLTKAGEEFVPLIVGLGTWGQRWSRRQLAEGETSLSLLIWALERSVEPSAFGKPQSVVRLELTDQTSAARLWWFVNRDGACELCLKDPGFEVDLYLAATLPDMIYVVRGDLPLGRALDSGRLEAIGTARARKALRAWLNLGPLTKIKSQHRFEAVGTTRRG